MSARRRAAIAVLLALAAAAVHHGALQCGFIAYDDDMYVYENPHLRDGFTRASVRWALTAHLTHDALPHLDYWQPLTVLSRLLDVELFGLEPRGHHATNILLHAVNAALLFLVLAAMTGAPWRSAFVAAVFAVHPLRVESVVWVTERKDVLSGLFWLATMAAYARFARRPAPRAYLAVVSLLVLGLLAKPVLVTLPFVLLLLDFWPLQRFGFADWRPLGRLVLEKIPLFVLAFVSVGITVASQARAQILVTLGTQPFALRVENAIVDYVRYAAKIVYPHPMALPQPYPVHPWPAWVVAAGAVALLIVSAAALASLRRRPYAAVGWFWFIGTLVPVIGLVQSGTQPMADRFTYIPHIGLAIAVTWAVADVAARWPRRASLVAGAAAAAIGALAVTSVGQTRHWRSSETLFRHSVSATTDNYAAHFNLANALAAQGRHPEAAAHYREAIAINPGHARAHNNLANVLAGQGTAEEAIRHYREAIRLNPRYADAHNNLGLLLSTRNQAEEARRLYQAALAAHPGHAGTLLNLGRLAAREGRLDEALDVLARAIDADPGLAAAHTSRAHLLARAGRLGEAEAHFRAAARLQPADAESRNNLGRALALQGRTGEAMAEYEAAVRASPGHPLVHVNIGRLLLAQGRAADALPSFQRALRLRPADAEAHLELGEAMAQLGRRDEACAAFREALRLEAKLDDARAAARTLGCGPPSPS